MININKKIISSILLWSFIIIPLYSQVFSPPNTDKSIMSSVPGEKKQVNMNNAAQSKSSNNIFGVNDMSTDIVVVDIPNQLEPLKYNAQTEHYVVVSEISQEHANTLSQQLEALFALYNSYFRFDTELLPGKMKVQIYNSKARYDQYLALTIQEKREGFVYLHYKDFVKRRLIGYQSDTDELFNSIKQQSFLQFFRSFISNPPLWLRIGFAVYFASSELVFSENNNKNIIRAELNEENLALLGRLKKIFTENVPGKPIGLDELWKMTVQTVVGQLEVFNAEAWGLVSFLLNHSDEKYQRVLWDLIAGMEQEASIATNLDNQNKVLAWVEYGMYREFETYIMDKLTYSDVLLRGQRYYNQKDFYNAHRMFAQAREMSQGQKDYIPDYFLGLIRYEQNKYEEADVYLQSALTNVDPENKKLIYYALGINAYQDNKYTQARKYLRMADVLINVGVNKDIQHILERLDLELDN